MSFPPRISLEGRVAIVTGSSRGIGRTIAKELAVRGAKVVTNYHKSTAAAEEIVTEIQSVGGEAQAFQADVSDFEQAQGLIKFSIDTFDGLDILVNNAGITRDNVIMMMTEEDWDSVQATNLKSAFNCSKPAVRYMMRKRYGRIINITSVAGQMGNPGQTNYSASKGGVIAFTKSLSRETARIGITANCICPGVISTAMTMALSEEVRADLKNMIPMRRFGDPEDVAESVLFFASEAAGYITGQVLAVDGGLI